MEWWREDGGGIEGTPYWLFFCISPLHCIH
jgi:hypothetical protein